MKGGRVFAFKVNGSFLSSVAIHYCFNYHFYLSEWLSAEIIPQTNSFIESLSFKGIIKTRMSLCFLFYFFLPVACVCIAPVHSQ